MGSGMLGLQQGYRKAAGNASGIAVGNWSSDRSGRQGAHDGGGHRKAGLQETEQDIPEVAAQGRGNPEADISNRGAGNHAGAIYDAENRERM